MIIINKMKVIELLLAIGLLSCLKAEVDGTIKMKIDGLDHEIYPVSPSGAVSHISIQDRKVTITAGGNVFMA